MKTLKVIYRFMNGYFGHRKLNQPYRNIWQVITWSTMIFLTTRFIMFPFFGVWNRVILGLNNVIWG